MTTIQVTGYGRLMNRLLAARRDFNKAMIEPSLKKLHRKFTRTFKQVFSPSSGGSAPYRHGYTGNYLRGLRHEIKPTSLKEIETVDDVGKFLRRGTRGSPMGTIPIGAVEWAMGKLGVPENEAWAIARSIAINGIGHNPSSPLHGSYPSGAAMFKFPEWMVQEKHKVDIDSTARLIGELFVTYVG